MGKKKKYSANSTIAKSSIEKIAPLIGAVAVIVAAYIGFLGIRAQVSVPISATQTAEARFLSTLQTVSSLPASTVESIFTPLPTSTIELTYTLTSIPNTNTIAITEIMVNPCGLVVPGEEAYWNEYIEIYNFGDDPIDVSGWWISDGEDLIGNPDHLVSWNTRFPGQQFGGNNDLKTDITIINPGQYALILSPQYLRSEQFRTPYLIPSGTMILTVENGSFLGDDFAGLEAVDELNTVVLYKGTADYIDQVISTYGTPRLSASPKNIKDDPNNRDKIPLVLGDCYSVERQDASGPDAEYNWMAIENGTPGSGPYNP